MIKMVTIMKTKKQYISPLTLEQVLNYSTVLCASGGGGDRVSSSIGVHGGDNSGDVIGAY